MSKYHLISNYQPTGDQPEAIRQLTEGLERGDKAQVLLGVTGSGKTFTMANVIANWNRPTLILSHNKTLAHQLYMEMKEFFPENAVEYYVSYYDYYQPEAYLPTTDTYIEKDLSINDEIDRLRLSAVSNLLSGRNDVIVVSSVSCIYGMGSPVALQENVIDLQVGQKLSRNALLRKLVQSLYVRNDLDLQRGNFRVKGDTVDIAMAYSEVVLRVTFWDDEIDAIEELDGVTYDRIAKFQDYRLYPANLFMTSEEQTNIAIHDIQDDLVKQIAYFEELGDGIKAQRIKERVEYDMEMIKELGHCSGIENYSRYFDGRKGARGVRYGDDQGAGPLLGHRELQPLLRRPEGWRTPLLPARLLPRRLSPLHRRESRLRAADQRYVRRRPQPQAEPCGIRLPPARRLRQPSLALRGVPAGGQSGDLRQRHPCRLRVAGGRGHRGGTGHPSHRPLGS